MRHLPLSRVAALLALAATAVAACRPTPQAAAGDVARTSGRDSMLMTDLAALAADSMEGRAVGTPGGERARRYVLRRFAEEGVRPFDGGHERPFTIPATATRPERRGVNVVGWLPGTDTTSRHWIVITAHYDHVGIGRAVNGDSIYNGADDNASGTAVLFALARALRAAPTRHPVLLAALDAEEGGLRGARALVAAPPVPAAQIALNVNMDMISHSASGELYAAGAHHTPAIRPILDRVARGAPVTLRQGHDRPELGTNDWTRQSDHGAFHAAGIPFVYFGVEDHPDYHKPSDEVRTITPEFYGNAVRTIEAAVRALDAGLETIRR